MNEFERFIENERSAMVDLMDALIDAGYSEEEAGHMLAAVIDEYDAIREIRETLRAIYRH